MLNLTNILIVLGAFILIRFSFRILITILVAILDATLPDTKFYFKVDTRIKNGVVVKTKSLYAWGYHHTQIDVNAGTSLPWDTQLGIYITNPKD